MEQNQKSTKKIFRNYGRSFVSYLFSSAKCVFKGQKMTHRILSPSCLKVCSSSLWGDGAVTFLFVASLPFFWLQLQVTFFFLRLKPMVLWWTLEEVVGAFCEK